MFLRYLLAYPEFKRVARVNKRDLEQNGHFGQPARNAGRCHGWFSRLG